MTDEVEQEQQQTTHRRDAWVRELPNEAREIVARIGGTHIANPKKRGSGKQLTHNWKEIVIQHCTSSITVNKSLLAKLLGISVRTLNTRMKRDGDELGDLIRASRGWLVKQLEAKVVTKALADDADPALVLKVLGRVDPENHNDSVMSARASKAPTVNIDQRQQAIFMKPLTTEEWLKRTAPALEQK
jgi:hypothetical protein